MGWNKRCSQPQLVQFFAAPCLVYVQDDDSAERATNVEKQYPSIHHKLSRETTGAATLATVLAEKGGLSSVLSHT